MYLSDDEEQNFHAGMFFMVCFSGLPMVTWGSAPVTSAALFCNFGTQLFAAPTHCFNLYSILTNKRGKKNKTKAKPSYQKTSFPHHCCSVPLKCNLLSSPVWALNVSLCGGNKQRKSRKKRPPQSQKRLVRLWKTKGATARWLITFPPWAGESSHPFGSDMKSDSRCDSAAEWHWNKGISAAAW